MQTNEWKIKFESLERMFRACHNVSQEENESEEHFGTRLQQEIEEYARRIGDNPNNVSHRFVRAKKKMKKVYEERPISELPVANQWEGHHSHKQKGGNRDAITEI